MSVSDYMALQLQYYRGTESILDLAANGSRPAQEETGRGRAFAALVLPMREH